MSKEQIVRTIADANRLLAMGYTIKRIDRNAADRGRCVFFFHYEEGIKEALEEINDRRMKKIKYLKSKGMI